MGEDRCVCVWCACGHAGLSEESESERRRWREGESKEE